LSQLYPPAFARPVTIPQTLLGYDLAGPPTLSRLVEDWRVEVLFGPAAVVLAAGYVWMVWRLRRDGRRWPARRTVAWLGGCAVLLAATCSGLGRYEPAMFSVHMASHMLLAVIVPGLWVQAAPLTLLSVVGTAPAEGLPGASDWLATLTSSAPARLLTHPLTAFGLFAGSPFAFYFSGAFDAAARFHWAHMAVDAYFLAVGVVFAWPTIGVDPAPRPVPNLVRVGMVLAASPFTAVFAALVVASPRVLGNGPAGYNMYTALDLPWIPGVPGLLADQRLGGVIALVIGEVGLFAAVVVLLVRWSAVDDDPRASGPDLSTQLSFPAHQVTR
jgi:putative copper resistance protein D